LYKAIIDYTTPSGVFVKTGVNNKIWGTTKTFYDSFIKQPIATPKVITYPKLGGKGNFAKNCS